MGVGQLSESDAVDALRLPFYSSSHPTGSHGWRNQFDLGNPDLTTEDSTETQSEVAEDEDIEQPLLSEGGTSEPALPSAVEPAPSEMSITAEPAETVPEVSEEQPIPEEVVERPRREEPIRPRVVSEALYANEVELNLRPPVDSAMISDLFNHLQAMPELRILRTIGSWDRGTTITVSLERPMPLIKMLSEFPKVRAEEGQTQTSGRKMGLLGSPDTPGGWANRIEITSDTD